MSPIRGVAFRLVSSVLAERRHVYPWGVATVAEAICEMNEKGVGALLVMDGHKPAGSLPTLRRIVDADRDGTHPGGGSNDPPVGDYRAESRSTRRWDHD
jgi:hypothetical protein